MNNNPTKALLELKRRRQIQQEINNSVFRQQLNFIEDPSRLKAALTTRRGGKSTAAGFYLVRQALAKPFTKCVFITRVRHQAENIMAMHVFDLIFKKLNIAPDYNKVKLQYTFSNGSTITMVGIDSGPSEMDKILGIKADLFVVDEAAFIQQDLERLVYQVLRPATLDTQGTVCLISTPSDKTHGLFFEVTTGKRSEWSVHKWTAYDNPFVIDEFTNDVNEMIAHNPNAQDTPYFRQMYLGEWVINTESRVYHFDSTRHTIPHMPPLKGREVRYALGIDLGYNDATALSVLAFITNDPTLYIVHTEKHSKIDVTQTGEKIESLRRTYNFTKMIADGASKQVVEELKRRFQMPIQVAEKVDKKGWIDFLNADMARNKIKLVDASTKALQDEYNNLTWVLDKMRAGIYEELPSCKNDLCDATLYIYRAFRPLLLTTEEHILRGSEAELDMHLQRQLYAQQLQKEYENDLF